MLFFSQMGKLTISIDFPALTEIVNYFVSGQQQKIDALTATVANLTQRLTASTTDLQQEVTENKQT